jgi:DNA polymerase I-like protein with 3'-5' exonuclease and polymerase domains
MTKALIDLGTKEFCGIKDSKVYLIDTMDKFLVFHQMLMQQKLVACDTETNSLDWCLPSSHVIGVSFGWDNLAFYIPFAHEASCLSPILGAQLNIDDCRPYLQEFFNREDITIIGHNWKFDEHFYNRAGITIKNPRHDTRILWQLYDENAPGYLKAIASGWKDITGERHDGIIGPEADALEEAVDAWRTEESKARRKRFTVTVSTKAKELRFEPAYQAYNLSKLKKLVRETMLPDDPDREIKKTDIHYGYVPIDLMAHYAGLDTYYTYALYKHCVKKIPWTPSMKDLYITEAKLARILTKLEADGVCIDSGYLKDCIKGFLRDEETLTANVQAVLGADLNLNSNKQLAAALIKHGVELHETTPTGDFVVDVDVLEGFSKDFPVLQDLMKLRLITKLRSTYAEAILSRLTEGNMLHCTFNQNVATGRMSCSDPNLQNIPAADTTIRRAFIKPPDFDGVYVFIDYSQVEVRLLAHFSQDPLLLSAYQNKQDVHTRAMCEIMGEFYDEAVKILKDHNHPRHKELDDLRTIFKRLNFGVAYGVSAPGLSTQIPRPPHCLELSPKQWIDQCQIYIDNYFGKYLGVKRFIHKISREVKKEGVIENPFGRLRRLTQHNAARHDRSKFWAEAKAQRQGVNFLVQGTAADLFKKAVVRVSDFLTEQRARTRIVNLVHDEIQFYVPKDEFHLLSGIKKCMEDFPEFSVPIVADVSWSTDNWANKRKL